MPTSRGGYPAGGKRIEEFGSPPSSWHGRRPPEEDHIVATAYRERDEARGERDRLAVIVHKLAGRKCGGGGRDSCVCDLIRDAKEIADA